MKEKTQCYRDRPDDHQIMSAMNKKQWHYTAKHYEDGQRPELWALLLELTLDEPDQTKIKQSFYRTNRVNLSNLRR